MRSVCLVPYCPWPMDTGTRVEMMKHLNILRSLGPCTIASARGRPVGFGWTQTAVESLKDMGFSLVFREDTERMTPLQALGMVYGALFKGIRQERAFGHWNPYHRFAFTQGWWRRVTSGADLAVIQYGLWSRLRSECPKVVVLQELLSNYHVGGRSLELRDVATSDHVLVVGYDEKETLERGGVRNVSWSPPAIEGGSLPLTSSVGLVGTTAPQNAEGLRWLEQADNPKIRIRVYGSLATLVRASCMEAVGRYEKSDRPYEECGIHLMVRPDRPGLQIKVVEALAYGRVIIARRGSMRGLPPGDGAWIDVETPEQMLQEAERLSRDGDARQRLSASASRFYAAHLAREKIIGEATEVYSRYGRMGMERPAQRM